MRCPSIPARQLEGIAVLQGLGEVRLNAAAEPVAPVAGAAVAAVVAAAKASLMAVLRDSTGLSY